MRYVIVNNTNVTTEWNTVRSRNPFPIKGWNKALLRVTTRDQARAAKKTYKNPHNYYIVDTVNNCVVR